MAKIPAAHQPEQAEEASSISPEDGMTSDLEALGRELDSHLAAMDPLPEVDHATLAESSTPEGEFMKLADFIANERQQKTKGKDPQQVWKVIKIEAYRQTYRDWETQWPHN